MDKIETYFRVFLENLISNKGSKQNVNQTHYPKTLEKLFGTSISKELSEMLGAIEKNESIFCLGELYNFDSSYLNFLDESSNKNAFECLLKSRSSPFMLVSIFTNTISFGGDGSGNIFYAEIDKQGSKIFFQDHENETSLLLIAESLPVFIYLNGIQEDL